MRGALRSSVALLLVFAAALRAQVAPNLHYNTLRTAHFRVHFSAGLEPTARRAAGSAERAYGRLAAELHPPRGTIELVVADNQDVSNGFTTTFPTNRIVIFARPTVDANALKFLDDWIDLVVSHELAHVFHLDRTEGWWRVGQWVFGRNPFLFPNQYVPSWVAEGIAVYYESRLTGSGRIEGTEHRSIARAQAFDGSLPKLNALSAATLEFPLGLTSYAYGSLLMEAMGKRRAADNMRAFIDVSAARTVPYLLNMNARRAFGITFDSGYRLLTDSISASAGRMGASSGSSSAASSTTLASPGATSSTVGWFAQRLRWTSNTTLMYGGSDGRDVSSLKELSGDSRTPRYVARRNSLDITSVLPSGARIFSQYEFTDPYSIRSDLYAEWNGATERLTHGARLLQPDATQSQSPDAGADRVARSVALSAARSAACAAPGTLRAELCEAKIVAVQLAPGASRLVRVAVTDTGVTITPLTGTSADTIWSEPRWSHDGTRIAAARWLRNGTSEIVVLDASGRVLTTLARSHAVTSNPAWASGDSTIYFSSDRSGRSELYRASVASGKLVRVASAPSALYEAEPSPDDKQLATLYLAGDGYHVTRLPIPAGPLPAADSTSVLAPSRRDPEVTSDAPVTNYSAWPSVLPHYWLPSIQQNSDGLTHWGFITTGRDVLARHQYDVTALYEPDRGEFDGGFNYTFAGFGNPLVGIGALQEWDHVSNIFRVSGADTLVVGTLRRRRRFLDAAVSLLRPRYRTNSSLSTGVEIELRSYASDPDALFAGLSATSRARFSNKTYPSVFVSAGWSSVRRPFRAISNEDGIQLSVTARQRWRADSASGTRSTSVVGAATAYKSLPFPGFAHHVLAVRGAVAWADTKSTSEFSAGGVSGQTVSIVPGVTVGEGRRSFPVRGFPAGAQDGLRAAGGSAEYRFPLALPSAGISMLPIFLQRLSGTVFADAATAWCPAGITASVVCPSKGIARDWMASVGGELQLDAAFDYDSPYRLRLGTAVPAAGRRYFGTGSITAYFAVGIPF